MWSIIFAFNNSPFPSIPWKESEQIYNILQPIKPASLSLNHTYLIAKLFLFIKILGAEHLVEFGALLLGAKKKKGAFFKPDFLQDFAAN